MRSISLQEGLQGGSMREKREGLRLAASQWEPLSAQQPEKSDNEQTKGLIAWGAAAKDPQGSLAAGHGKHQLGSLSHGPAGQGPHPLPPKKKLAGKLST